MTINVEVEPGDVPEYYCRDDVPENIEVGDVVYIVAENKYYIEDGK